MCETIKCGLSPCYKCDADESFSTLRIKTGNLYYYAFIIIILMLHLGLASACFRYLLPELKLQMKNMKFLDSPAIIMYLTIMFSCISVSLNLIDPFMHEGIYHPILGVIIFRLAQATTHMCNTITMYGWIKLLTQRIRFHTISRRFFMISNGLFFAFLCIIVFLPDSDSLLSLGVAFYVCMDLLGTSAFAISLTIKLFQASKDSATMIAASSTKKMKLTNTKEQPNAYRNIMKKIVRQAIILNSLYVTVFCLVMLKPRLINNPMLALLYWTCIYALVWCTFMTHFKIFLEYYTKNTAKNSGSGVIDRRGSSADRKAISRGVKRGSSGTAGSPRRSSIRGKSLTPRTRRESIANKKRKSLKIQPAVAPILEKNSSKFEAT